MANRGVMTEAIPEEDYERQQRGLPPFPKPPPSVSDPPIPKVKNRIPRAKIDVDHIARLVGHKQIVVDPDGVRHIGFSVTITGKDEKAQSGWIPEMDMEWIRNETRGRLDLDEITN